MDSTIAINQLHKAAKSGGVRVKRITPIDNGKRFSMELILESGSAVVSCSLTEVLTWDADINSRQGGKVRSRQHGLSKGKDLRPYDDKDRVLDVYDALGTIVATAEHFGVCETTIAKRLREWGLEESKPRVSTDKLMRLVKAQMMLQNRPSYQRIAEIAGVSKATVTRTVKKLRENGILQASTS